MIGHIAIDDKDGTLILAENGKDMVISCPIEKYYAGVDEYNKGELIQNAFPFLDKTEREFLLTGLTPEQQEKVFGW